MLLRLGATRNASTHANVTQHGHAMTQISRTRPSVVGEPDEERRMVGSAEESSQHQQLTSCITQARPRGRK